MKKYTHGRANTPMFLQGCFSLYRKRLSKDGYRYFISSGLNINPAVEDVFLDNAS